MFYNKKPMNLDLCSLGIGLFVHRIEITNTVNCNILRINRFYSVHGLDKFAAD